MTTPEGAWPPCCSTNMGCTNWRPSPMRSSQNLLVRCPVMLGQIAVSIGQWLDTSAERVVGLVLVAGVTQKVISLIQLLVAIHAMLSIRYPHREVLIVNDGSKDDTLQTLIDNFALRPSARDFETITPHKPILQNYQSRNHPNLIVIDKENGGKVVSVGLPRDLLPLIFGIFIQNFGYRQLNTIWRIQGWWEFLRKKKSWGEMTRTGFQSSR